MSDILAFNTGRPYTDKGQRIAAKITDTGGLLFVDIDRGIHGYIRPDLMTKHGLLLRRPDVQWAYDYLSSQWDCMEPHRRPEEIKTLTREAREV